MRHVHSCAEYQYGHRTKALDEVILRLRKTVIVPIAPMPLINIPRSHIACAL
jgi:hypothetical protein